MAAYPPPERLARFATETALEDIHGRGGLSATGWGSEMTQDRDKLP
jgi:hypothetical protein